MIKNQFDYTSPGIIYLFFSISDMENQFHLNLPHFRPSSKIFVTRCSAPVHQTHFLHRIILFNVYQMHLHIATPSPSVICKKTFVLLVDLTKRLPNLSKTDSTYITIFFEEHS